MPLCFLPSLNGGPQKLYLDESGTLGYSGEVFTMAIVLVRDLPGLETSVAKHRVTQTESKASQMKTAQKLALARTLIEENGLEIFLADLDPRAAMASERKLDKDMLYDSMAGQALAYYLQRGDLERGLSYRLSMDIRGSLRESYEDLVRGSIGNVLMHRDEPLVTDIDVRFLDSKFSAGVQAADLFSNVYRTALSQKDSPCQGFLRKYVDEGVVHAGFTFGLPQLADQMMQIANDLRALVELEAGSPYVSLFDRSAGEGSSEGDTGLFGEGGRDGSEGETGSRRTRGRRGGRGRRGRDREAFGDATGREPRENAEERETNVGAGSIGVQAELAGKSDIEPDEEAQTVADAEMASPEQATEGRRGASRRARRGRNGRLMESTLRDAEGEGERAIPEAADDLATGRGEQEAQAATAADEGTDQLPGEPTAGHGTSRSARRRRARSARITHRLASEAEAAEEAASIAADESAAHASQAEEGEGTPGESGHAAPQAASPMADATTDTNPEETASEAEGSAREAQDVEPSPAAATQASPARGRTRGRRGSRRADGEGAAAAATASEATSDGEEENASEAIEGSARADVHPGRALRLRQAASRSRRAARTSTAAPQEDASSRRTAGDRADAETSTSDSLAQQVKPAEGTPVQAVEAPAPNRGKHADASVTQPAGVAPEAVDTTPGATPRPAAGTPDEAPGAATGTPTEAPANPPTPPTSAATGTPSETASAGQSSPVSKDAATPDAPAPEPASGTAKPTRTRTRTRKRSTASAQAADTKDAPTEAPASAGEAASPEPSGDEQPAPEKPKRRTRTRRSAKKSDAGEASADTAQE